MSQDQFSNEDPLFKAWSEVVDMINKIKNKESQMFALIQLIDNLMAQVDQHSKKTNKTMCGDEVDQLFSELSKKAKAVFPDSNDAKPFHAFILASSDFGSPNGMHLPEEVKPYWRSDYTDHFGLLALNTQLILTRAIQLPENGLDHSNIQGLVCLEESYDHEAVKKYFFNRLPLYKHKAELEPFFNAAKIAMANFEKRPLTALRKLFMLYQEVRKNVNITGGEDVAEFYNMLFVMFGKFPDKYRRLFDQTVLSLSDDFGVYLSIQDTNEMGKFVSFLNVVSDRGFQSQPAKDIQPSQRSKKIAEVFCKREKLAIDIINDKNNDPFYLKGGMPLSATMEKWFDKITDQYDRTHGLSIEKLTDYIVTHPESAEHFLKRRSVGNRNFRGEFCRNHELVHKLLNSEDPKILEAMQTTKFLDSTHLPDRLRKSFKEKLKTNCKLAGCPQNSKPTLKHYANSALNEILDMLDRGMKTAKEYVAPAKSEDKEDKVPLMVINSDSNSSASEQDDRQNDSRAVLTTLGK